MSHKVLVCGGRDYQDRDFAFAALDRFAAKFGVECVIHGAAKGADTLADEWAGSRGVSVRRFPANWERDGKAAGLIRNQEMIDKAEPTAVIAFPGGRGTADMVARAKRHGIPVYRPT